MPEKNAAKTGRKRTHAATCAGIALLAVGATIVLIFINGTGKTGRSEKFRPGPLAPTASLELLDGSHIQLGRNTSSEPLILGFFLNNCESCIEGLRTMARVASTLKPQPVKVIAINLGPAGPKALAGFAREIDARSIKAAKQISGPSLPQKLGVASVDTTIVINRTGHVLANEVGMSEDDQIAAAKAALTQS